MAIGSEELPCTLPYTMGVFRAAINQGIISMCRLCPDVLPAAPDDPRSTLVTQSFIMSDLFDESL